MFLQNIKLGSTRSHRSLILTMVEPIAMDLLLPKTHGSQVWTKELTSTRNLTPHSVLTRDWPESITLALSSQVTATITRTSHAKVYTSKMVLLTLTHSLLLTQEVLKVYRRIIPAQSIPLNQSNLSLYRGSFSLTINTWRESCQLRRPRRSWEKPSKLWQNWGRLLLPSLSICKT